MMMTIAISFSEHLSFVRTMRLCPAGQFQLAQSKIEHRQRGGLDSVIETHRPATEADKRTNGGQSRLFHSTRAYGADAKRNTPLGVTACPPHVGFLSKRNFTVGPDNDATTTKRTVVPVDAVHKAQATKTRCRNLAFDRLVELEERVTWRSQMIGGSFKSDARCFFVIPTRMQMSPKENIEKILKTLADRAQRPS